MERMLGACDRFEAPWKAAGTTGPRPHLEDYLMVESAQSRAPARPSAAESLEEKEPDRVGKPLILDFGLALREEKEMATVTELPQVREAFGFRRTECDCAFCKVYCRHLPGALDPSDLARLCPPGQEVFAWAEQHLRALCDKPYPTLVPARRQDGACHWYFDGRCAVHDQAPYSCAFFDAHMPPAEVERREVVTIQAIRQDAAASGLYGRVWRHLRQKGLVARPADRSALTREMQQIQWRAAALRRRAQGSASD